MVNASRTTKLGTSTPSHPRWSRTKMMAMQMMAVAIMAMAASAAQVELNGSTELDLTGSESAVELDIDKNIIDVDPAEHWPYGKLNCAHGFRKYQPLTQKRTYYVGVHATAGIETAWREFNLTFEEYLTRTVGQRFDQPLTFKMKVTVDPLRDWVDNEEEVDFMYSDTGLFSCIGVEIGGQPLGTTISHLEVRGKSENLDVYAGSIIVRADNKELQSVSDLKNRIIAAQSISDFSAAQVQFYTMLKKGLNYIMDPKQVIFTENQEDIVLGVLDGRFEVGFVRTGQIERSLLPDGNPVDPDDFRVLDPRIYVMDTLDLFPFLHSTPVFPEWPLYARENVDRMVSEEVAVALINLEYHKTVGDRMHHCKQDLCEAANDPNCTNTDTDICDTAPPVWFDPTARCDTTRELAELAFEAGIAGRHNGFRPARSHFSMRSMQQEAGFLVQNEEGNWHCPRASSLYEAIRCPVGTYKVNEDVYAEQCEKIGLPCSEGYSCYCKPCVRAFEVDVVEFSHNGQPLTNDTRLSHVSGCEKMSLCGTVQQTKEVVFHAYDNRERGNTTVRAVMHVGQESFELPAVPLGNGSFGYEFSYSDHRLGVGILEVYFDGQQIPESPFRVQVVERNCDKDYPGQGKAPTETGTCECGSGTIEIAGDCMPMAVFASIIAIVIGFVLFQFVWCYWSYKRAKNDEAWQVGAEELHFSDPIEVIGEGAFGVVLLAEYRGTKVAIKRVLPTDGPKRRGRSKERSSQGSRQRSKSGGSKEAADSGGMASIPDSMDLEAQALEEEGAVQVNPSTLANGYESYAAKSGSLIDSELDFLGGLSYNRRREGLAKWFPWLFPDNLAHYNGSVLGSASGTNTQKSTFQKLCPWLDENARRQQEFMVEMRLLSRLRHPCITTVMGAVVTRGQQPMMVMEYMENGSLHDLLRNETLYTGGEIIMQIVRDVAQGLRFLHASKPPILHGDLKAKNILIDSRFRAKVADFGLATKTRRSGISGTPFWMAPEYLRGREDYNSACDIYSFGIILYEIYARKQPYEGENPRKVLRAVCDPRKNKRPPVPDTCPPKLVEVMKKCWSPDPFFRPQAKDLDMLFMDMNPRDCEPVLDSHEHLQKTRTGDMLYEVFPKKVADQLREGKKVEQENHDNVTILFSDIVHFTQISQMMSPAKVCTMLDNLYLAFDELARKHKVFKVETIGDAWMGVTNLENDQTDDHVARIARFAMEAVQAAGLVLIDQENPKKGYVKIRVGFHSGGVVSNVIGSLNPRFGLFGDTVNTASRMESNSVSGKIHCSQQSAQLLAEQAPEIPLWKRGKIGVKGKGQMVTYWVGIPPTSPKRGDASESGVVRNVDFCEASERATSERAPNSEISGHADYLNDTGTFAKPVTKVGSLRSIDATEISPIRKESAPEKPVGVEKAPLSGGGNVSAFVDIGN